MKSSPHTEWYVGSFLSVLGRMYFLLLKNQKKGRRQGRGMRNGDYAVMSSVK